MDFSIILQDPTIRDLVQTGALERGFHDSLFPAMLFRSEVEEEQWLSQVGDSLYFSAPGLLKPVGRQLTPGVDPAPKSYTVEQWEATMESWGDTIDTHMPTSILAIANLFLRNAHQLGLQSGQSLNRIVRNRFYNAAGSGWTVATANAVATTTIQVARISGFTHARNPALTGASRVRFAPVSSANPLNVRIFDNGAEASFQVVGATPTNPGDLYGPGTLTLSSAVTNVATRGYIYAEDASLVVRAGGGKSTDSISSVDLPKLSDVRAIVAQMRNSWVPKHPDGRYHCHLDPVSVSKLFDDDDLKRLNQSLPDYYMYRELIIGELHECLFFTNEECPQTTTVDGADTASYSMDDQLGLEMWSNGNTSTGTPLHWILFTGAGAMREYYNDQSGLITEAGLTGKMVDPRISNSGIEVNTDRVQLILRAPQNRMQDIVAASWRFMGTFVPRTDAAVGIKRRYKREALLCHGE